MKQLDASLALKPSRPVRVVQFGEGNFLRAFVDYMLDIANEQTGFNGGIVLVKPIQMGNLDEFRKQNCVYTVCLRGRVNGNEQVLTRQITSVNNAVDAYAQYDEYAALAKLDTLRFVVSNTTEAGIVYDENDRMALEPPASFPGKLTKFLFERAEHFHYALDKGLVMLPVELIDDNGKMLKKCVLRQCENWGLPEKFVDWVNNACVFASTLVDRIVTGYPRDEAERAKLFETLGYEDHLLVTGEPFALWVIESEKDISGELPLKQCGLPVIFTDDQGPYKRRKVRILNGAHTSFVPAAFLMGCDTVLDAMNDKLVRAFMQGVIYNEVIPTLDLPKDELMSFSDAVIDRFSNPYIRHMLLSITLNSVSKWRARCMPSLLEYVKLTGRLPKRLAFSLAALMAFDRTDERRDDALIGHRDGQEYRILDDKTVLDFFQAHAHDAPDDLTRAFLSAEAFWGRDLTSVPGLEELVAEDLKTILAAGVRAAMEACLHGGSEEKE